MIGVGRKGCTTVVRWVSIGGFKEHKRAENKLCICIVDDCIVRASLSNQSANDFRWDGGVHCASTTVALVGVKWWFKGALESREQLYLCISSSSLTVASPCECVSLISAVEVVFNLVSEGS